MKTTLPMVALLLLVPTGCAQSLFSKSFLSQSFVGSHAKEQRVIQQFADAVTEENEASLRRITSVRFEEKAMSSKDALTDLRVVHLPTGELTVVEVKETGEAAREVIVKEATGGKYQFQLVNDPAKGYWVVDDVLVRQKGKGTRIAKSTTEIMDLLKTLREFLDVWASGSREEILAMTSPELARSLEPLPEQWLSAITSRTASFYEEGMARKPEANLTDNNAVVKLPARNGHLMMKIVRGPEGWLVDDVELHNHREDNHPGSVRRQADAINTVNGFLTAYGAADQETLELLTEKSLYESSLKIADLSMVQLPNPADVPAEFDIRAYESRLTIMLPSGSEIVRLDLKERDNASADEFEDSPQRFIIEDVTLYDRSTQKQRSLSAVFTAPTRASLFLKALADRDHKVLSHVSTTEFSRATWKRVSPQILAALAIPDLYAEGVKLTGSHDVADTTELEFQNSGGLAFTCRLLDQNGGLKIDDVQYPNQYGQVTSLRTQLELTVPLLEFANAWESGNIMLLQKSCSSDFNRLVWSHMENVPQQFPQLQAQLRMPPKETQVTLERATIQLNSHDKNSRVTASLITEHDFWVIDEIKIDSSHGNTVAIRARLRGQIASKLLNGSYSMVHSADGHDRVIPVKTGEDSAIQQASAEATTNFHKGNVSHAVFNQFLSESPVKDFGQTCPVAPAVQTTEQSADRQQFADAVVTAGYQRSAAVPADGQIAQGNAVVGVRTGSGMQVFGPAAEAAANSIDLGDRKRQLFSTAIDITEDAPPGKERPVPEQSRDQSPPSGARTSPSRTVSRNEPGVMYFGPAQNELTEAAAERSVTEPADAPISIE